MDTRIDRHVLLHAPNIHVGGGLQLLKSLLRVCPIPFVWGQLDSRIQGECLLPDSIAQHWVKKSVWSRLRAEWRIYQRCAPDDTVLCLHGVPPLFRLRGRVVVLVQNRLLFDASSLKKYPIPTRVRLMVERRWVRTMSQKCDRYIVQTPSMARIVTRALGNQVTISILPFTSKSLGAGYGSTGASFLQYDFVYIASGDSHKNHGNLLLAWLLLAEAGYMPSLALTVDEHSHPRLANEIAKQREQNGLNIVNLGKVDSANITALYKSSSALIFPSTVESFGLPLIEASQLGLPVLASELDYVRDVIEPIETFDPDSAISIARAVRRFLKDPEPIALVGTAEEFMTEVLK